MRFRQVAMVLAVAALVGCKPATPEAATSSATPTDSGATQAQLASATGSGCRTHDRPREVGSGRTPIQICALPDAHLMSSDNAPDFGFTVATLQNLGPERDARWKLESKKLYFLRVFKARPDQTEDGYYEISSKTGTSWDQAIAIGSLVHCGISADHPEQKRAHAGFSTCALGEPKDAEDAATLTTPLRFSDGPAWITCKEGCCTTGAL